MDIFNPADIRLLLDMYCSMYVLKRTDCIKCCIFETMNSLCYFVCYKTWRYWVRA